jgi:hypothetical protein
MPFERRYDVRRQASLRDRSVTKCGAISKCKANTSLASQALQLRVPPQKLLSDGHQPAAAVGEVPDEHEWHLRQRVRLPGNDAVLHSDLLESTWQLRPRGDLQGSGEVLQQKLRHLFLDSELYRTLRLNFWIWLRL